MALPFAVAALIGLVLGYAAITSSFPGWIQGIARLLAAAALVGAGLLLVSEASGAGWTDGAFGLNGSVGNIAYALAFGCVVALVRKLLFPSFFPDTVEEARKQGRDLRRILLVSAGTVLAFAGLAALVFGFLALAAHLTAWLLG
jgi:protein-S-isoprenylcysteine O-methyltransferase Ste14